MKLNTKQPLWVLIIVRVVFAPVAIPFIVVTSLLVSFFYFPWGLFGILVEIKEPDEEGNIDLSRCLSVFYYPIVLPALAVYYYFKKGDVLLELKDK